MGKAIVPSKSKKMLAEARQWESRIFEQVCTAGQREASQYLETLEEWLFAQRPAGWKVVGYRKRTLVTRFGEVHIQRRLYRDPYGGYDFLLDEFLGQRAYQAATPDMQKLCTLLTPFERRRVFWQRG